MRFAFLPLQNGRLAPTAIRFFVTSDLPPHPTMKYTFSQPTDNDTGIEPYHTENGGLDATTNGETQHAQSQEPTNEVAIEDAAIAKIALPKKELYFVFAGLMLSLLCAALDNTIVSTALPTIVSELQAEISDLSWVAAAYVLSSTALAPSYGRISDAFGRRNVFMVCIGIFLIGSTLCGASQSIEMLIGSRALQGIGGGGIMSLNYIIMSGTHLKFRLSLFAESFDPTDVVSLRERGKYMGVLGSTWAL